MVEMDARMDLGHADALEAMLQTRKCIVKEM